MIDTVPDEYDKLLDSIDSLPKSQHDPEKKNEENESTEPKKE